VAWAEKDLKKGNFFKCRKLVGKKILKSWFLLRVWTDRETVIWTKFAAAFTYFMAINFFLTFLGFIYFLFFTNFGVVAALVFLLLNGVVFALVNFLLLVPFLFYSQEAGSFLLYFLLAIFIVFMASVGYFLSGFILQYPIIFIILSIPFSVLVGYLFFSLYWHRFLTNDLD